MSIDYQEVNTTMDEQTKEDIEMDIMLDGLLMDGELDIIGLYE